MIDPKNASSSYASNPPFLSETSAKFNGAFRNLLQNENGLRQDVRDKFLDELRKNAHSSRNIRYIFENCMGQAVRLHITPEEQVQNNDHIPFNQAPLIGRLDSVMHKTLKRIEKKHQGLCEIICNYVLKNNLLGTGDEENYLINEIKVDNLNQGNIKKSHILNVYGIFRKAIAFLFGIYPDNIFSFRAQRKLIEKKTVTEEQYVNNGNGLTKANITCIKNCVNRTLLQNKFHALADNETLKLETIEKTWFSFGGHATLIKKISADNYIFFDPNVGETRNLNFNNLCDKIDDQLDKWGSDLFFTRGEDYKKRML